MPIHAHPCYSNCVHVIKNYAHVFKNWLMCITRLHQVLVGSDKLKIVHYRWRLFTKSCPPIIIWNPCPPMPNNITAMPTHAHPKPMGMGTDGRGRGRPLPVPTMKRKKKKRFLGDLSHFIATKLFREWVSTTLEFILYLTLSCVFE